MLDNMLHHRHYTVVHLQLMRGRGLFSEACVEVFAQIRSEFRMHQIKIYIYKSYIKIFEMIHCADKLNWVVSRELRNNMQVKQQGERRCIK